MRFEDRPTTKKGQIGEAIVDAWIISKGFVPYRPVNGCKHPFDRLVASADKRRLCIVEVKTKPRREAYPDTGIEPRHFNDYQHVTTQHRMPLFLAFVDEVQAVVYGNWWSKLLVRRPGPVTSTGMPRCGWTTGYPWEHKGIVYFQLDAMEPIAQLTPEQCEQLRALRTTNWIAERAAFTLK